MFTRDLWVSHYITLNISCHITGGSFFYLLRTLIPEANPRWKRRLPSDTEPGERSVFHSLQIREWLFSGRHLWGSDVLRLVLSPYFIRKTAGWILRYYSFLPQTHVSHVALNWFEYRSRLIPVRWMNGSKNEPYAYSINTLWGCVCVCVYRGVRLSGGGTLNINRQASGFRCVWNAADKREEL